MLFLNRTNFSLNNYRNQIKLLNVFQNSNILCKISTFHYYFLARVTLQDYLHTCIQSFGYECPNTLIIYES